MPDFSVPDIIPLTEDHWPGAWRVLEPVIRAGETYPYAMDMDENQAFTKWVTNTSAAYVALDSETNIIGTYYIKPNQDPLGAHICNCGYVTAEHARCQGVGMAMCQHSMMEAKRLGFNAMQYNLVVASNIASFRLWLKMGFIHIGTIPKAFRHAKLGLTDAHIFYKHL